RRLYGRDQVRAPDASAGTAGGDAAPHGASEATARAGAAGGAGADERKRIDGWRRRSGRGAGHARCQATDPPRFVDHADLRRHRPASDDPPARVMAMRHLSISALCTAAALFLLYTNWPVVAAQRGIVPEGTALLVPLLLAVAAVHQLVARRRGLVVDRTFLLMLGFLVVLLMGTVFAEGYDVAIERILVYLTEGLLIYVLVRHAVRSLPDLRVATLAVLAGGALLAGLTIFQTVTDNYDQEVMGLAPRTLEHPEELPPDRKS